MSVNFNHTIVWAQDSEGSATFLAEILGLPAPKRWGPFQVVTTDNGTNVDFMNADGEITPVCTENSIGRRRRERTG